MLQMRAHFPRHVEDVNTPPDGRCRRRILSKCQGNRRDRTMPLALGVKIGSGNGVYSNAAYNVLRLVTAYYPHPVPGADRHAAPR